jgi:hypothetical protein
METAVPPKITFFFNFQLSDSYWYLHRLLSVSGVVATHSYGIKYWASEKQATKTVAYNQKSTVPTVFFFFLKNQKFSKNDRF